MFSVEQMVSQQYPSLALHSPRFTLTLVQLLRFVLREQDFKNFEYTYPHLQGIDFIEQVLSYFNVNYSIRPDERNSIPASGSVVIIANHPIGTLDGLVLLKLIHEIRPDIKVIANNILQHVKPLGNLLLPVNNMAGITQRNHIKAIHDHLRQGKAVIIFPAGEVSRLGPGGIRDGKWNSGFLRIAQSASAPIVPIYVNGKNSTLFYSLSLLCKPLSTLWLAREMFKQKNTTIDIRIGEPVNFNTYHTLSMPNEQKVHLFRKHLYRIGQDKQGLLKTDVPIALPENKQLLRQAVRQGQKLGQTRDGKDIYLHDYIPDSPLLREIGRLREHAFRAVGEGSGKRRDRDSYDMHYQHLVLWDDDDLEIVGSYRWCPTASKVDQTDDLYTHELFEYSDAFRPFLNQGLELGRSFVQPRYWGKRSLDYLWQGIGAYLTTQPNIRYLFGPVSISQNYPAHAVALLVYFYRLYFGNKDNIVRARLPYRITNEKWLQLSNVFSGNDYAEDFCTLKTQLGQMGLAIPTLYKQYTELCAQGGVQFLDFNIDPSFSNCIDGFVVVDLHHVKSAKLNRYMNERAYSE